MMAGLRNNRKHMPFSIRQLNEHEQLCDKLKALRKESRFTLSQIAEKTKIPKTSIRHLEAGAYHKLPDPIYTRNFLKIYLRALGADETYHLDLYEQEHGTCDFVKQARLPRQRTRALQFLVASRFMKIGVFFLVAASVVFYLGSQIRTIIRPPQLAVYDPADGYVTTDATISITGAAEQDASVKINGIDVLLTKNGSFEYELALERGLNVIKVESVKRYSKPSIEYRRVVLDQNRSVTMVTDVDK